MPFISMERQQFLNYKTPQESCGVFYTVSKVTTVSFMSSSLTQITP